MVKVDINPFKSEVNVVDGYFYYKENQTITFDGLNQERRPTMLKFVRDKYVMLKFTSAHKSNKHIAPYVRQLGLVYIEEVID